MVTEKFEIWGPEVIDPADSADRARIGLVIDLTTDGDYCTISTDIWFHSRAGVIQSAYDLKFNGESVTGVRIDTSAYKKADGYTEYHDVFKVKLTSEPIVQIIKRTDAAQTVDLAASLTGIAWVGSSSIMTVSKTFTIPGIGKYDLSLGYYVNDVWHSTGDNTIARFNLFVNGGTIPVMGNVGDFSVSLSPGTTYLVELVWLDSGYECIGDTSISGTLTQNTEVAFHFAQFGICKIHNGTSSEDYIAHIHDGDSHAAYIPYVHNGTGWEPYNG